MKYRRKPPQQTPKLGEMVRIIASFGGFLARTKALLEGLEKVRQYALGIIAVARFMLTLIELWVIVCF